MKHTEGTHFIGITGGVGAGKSRVLRYLKETVSCRIIYADEEALKFYVPGNDIFGKIIEAVGEDVLDDAGGIDKRKMAAKIFSDDNLLLRVNDIVHPAVRDVIIRTMDEARALGDKDFLFVEAALLIECGYESILDELWYVYASEDTRRSRLKESRGYTDGKIDGIFVSQLSEDEYRKHCHRVIDNDSSIEVMQDSVDGILKEYLG